jgi:hypothetical protein
MRFRGSGAAVFLAAAPRRAARRLTVILDGRRRTVRLRGRAGLRRPVFARFGLRRGRVHRLVLRAPVRGVRLDAVAVRR